VHNILVRYVVQELEGSLFLCPLDGDVGYTTLLHEAGRFTEYGEAVDTAAVLSLGAYRISEVVERS
jgi:hypothetical protein